MLPLLGLAVVVFGFAFRLHPLLVVTAAGWVAGLAAGLSPLEVLAAFGHAFNESRTVSVIFVVLPVVGLLERRGLQMRARELMASLSRTSAGGLLTVYLLVRQITAALGLVALGGHAQMVRPLLAPMTEAAAERNGRRRTGAERERLRAHAAAVDNIGAFFGEDVFVAFGSVLLIQKILHGEGAEVSPLRLSLLAAPTALAAFAVHAVRLRLLDRSLARAAAEEPEGGAE